MYLSTLVLEGPEAFHDGIVVTAAGTAHRTLDAQHSESLLMGVGRVLAAAGSRRSWRPTPQVFVVDDVSDAGSKPAPAARRPPAPRPAPTRRTLARELMEEAVRLEPSRPDYLLLLASTLRDEAYFVSRTQNTFPAVAIYDRLINIYQYRRVAENAE